MSDRTKMNGKPVFTVPSRTVINFKSGFKEKLLCDGPTFTAGTCCPFSCSFCYVPAVMAKQGAYLHKHGVVGEHEDVVVRRADAVDIAEKQLLSHPHEERMKRKVIYASPLTDVAANIELCKETTEICKRILHRTNWDIRLLSKSNLLPYIAGQLEGWSKSYPEMEFKPKERVIYGVSTGTLDDKLAAAFEEGTPKVSKRIESLRWLQDNGFRTFGMICPSLPQKDYLAFALEMAKAIRADRCEHVWAEVINVRGNSFEKTFLSLVEAGFKEEAELLSAVSSDPDEWEHYARKTFLAHACITTNRGKLRFLQYVNDKNRSFWECHKENGAVLL